MLAKDFIVTVRKSRTFFILILHHRCEKMLDNRQDTFTGKSISENNREKFNEQRIAHWNERTHKPVKKGVTKSYHQLLKRLFRQHIPENSKILEIGCFRGDLLNALSPSHGVGVDFSDVAVKHAREKYPHLTFHCLDGHDLHSLSETFDYIILSDLINDVYDVQCILEQVKRLCTPNTRIIFNFQSHLWSPMIRLARKCGVAHDQLLQNWFTMHDIKNMLNIVGFDIVSSQEEILFPTQFPLIGRLLNTFLARIWPLTHLCLSHFVIARPRLQSAQQQTDKSVSVIVAARNEAGHISDILDRVPKMGAATELIFVEGGSSDNTYDVIQQEIAEYTRMPVSLYKQPGKGKGDAVRLGFEKAQNDILMILDADMTVMPEDLPRFYNALVSGTGEFVNGVRLVYPMEDKAMRFLNLLGNKFFSLGFSFTLGQPIKDTLCGTKVLYRTDYEKIAANREYFGDFDPYGDFDLIFGAAKQNLKMVDMPIRYQARVYGDTNINRWEGGWLLLKMLIVALKKIKFI